MTQVLAMAIKLLNDFLGKYVERCGEVVEAHRNIGEFATYSAKDCYPKGLNRQCYIDSFEFHRCLEGTRETGIDQPRELPASYID